MNGGCTPVFKVSEKRIINHRVTQETTLRVAESFVMALKIIILRFVLPDRMVSFWARVLKINRGSRPYAAISGPVGVPSCLKRL
jgi:hypothetical protein